MKTCLYFNGRDTHIVCELADCFTLLGVNYFFRIDELLQSIMCEL